MGLQCDPTVIYALERAGRYTGNLTRDDLQFDSPYNTYRYAGPAAGPDRRARPARRSRPPRIRRTCPTSTSSAATTARTRSRRTLDEHNRNVFDSRRTVIGRTQNPRNPEPGRTRVEPSRTLRNPA